MMLEGGLYFVFEYYVWFQILQQNLLQTLEQSASLFHIQTFKKLYSITPKPPFSTLC